MGVYRPDRLAHLKTAFHHWPRDPVVKEPPFCFDAPFSDLGLASAWLIGRRLLKAGSRAKGGTKGFGGNWEP